MYCVCVCRMDVGLMLSNSESEYTEVSFNWILTLCHHYRVTLKKKLQHSCGVNKKASGGLSDTEVKKHCGQVPKARARTHTHKCNQTKNRQ